ncbi:hypothetical protein GOODEAATRI_019692 [Goodea atripinnis]|uniref:Uncharacterized protein n=1 Tax=Goodea atripinnis TaxID=208336 RepID=A0ABV0NLM2_9TELE
MFIYHSTDKIKQTLHKWVVCKKTNQPKSESADSISKETCNWCQSAESLIGTFLQSVLCINISYNVLNKKKTRVQSVPESNSLFVCTNLALKLFLILIKGRLTGGNTTRNGLRTEEQRQHSQTSHPLTCNEWVFELLLPFYHLEPVSSFFSDHQPN